MSGEELQALRAELLSLRQSQTRAVSTKQELIETRDRLDAEVRRYRQLAEFTRRALPVEELDAFADMSAEALVEMFDLEFAALVLCDADSGASVAGVCGPPRYRGRSVPLEALAHTEAVKVDASDPLCVALGLHEAYVAPVGDGSLRGAVVGGTRREKASLTAALAPESVQSFGVVAFKVDSLLRNLETGRVIRGKNRELEELNQARTQFFANVSHEIRTPLNSIINVPAGLLLAFETEARARCENGHAFVLDADDEAATQCPSCDAPLERYEHRRFTGAHDELYDLLDVAARNGRYLLELVDDILDASRLSAGKHSLSFQRVAITEVLASAQAACRSALETGEVELDVRLDAEAWVRGDSARLVQIITNLLGNAIKFSSPHSTVRLGMETDASGVRVWVEDEGPGIDAAHHVAIFESFRQVPRSGHTEGKQGTGLGLAIARQLAEAHGGRIELRSRVGVGSTFTLFLPTIEGEAR
ncbi:MAG: sensor histidine kinase [Nannocystales bacterium]